MQESLSALLVFGIVIAVVLLYIFRKQLITVLIFIVLAFAGFLFFRSGPKPPVTNDIKNAEVSITSTISTLWDSLQSGFTTAQSIYNLFKANEDITNQLAATDPTEITNSISQSIDFLKGIGQILPDVPLPNAQEIENYSQEEKNTFLQSLTSVFTNAVVTQEVAIDDQVPEGAIQIAEGLFTNQLALTTAQGLVTQYSLDSGVLALYFKELQIPFGPELGIYLAKVDSGTVVLSDDFLFVSPLKSFEGNQLYFLPEQQSIIEYNTVFIYSPVLNQVYAIAPMR